MDTLVLTAVYEETDDRLDNESHGSKLPEFRVDLDACDIDSRSWFVLPNPCAGEDRPAASSLPVNRGVGQRLSNFTLTDVVNHRPVSLYGFAGKKAVVLVFLGADCPLANLYGPRLAELDREFRGKGVAFLGINSNAHESESPGRRARAEARDRLPRPQGRGQRRRRPGPGRADLRGPRPRRPGRGSATGVRSTTSTASGSAQEAGRRPPYLQGRPRRDPGRPGRSRSPRRRSPAACSTGSSRSGRRVGTGPRVRPAPPEIESALKEAEEGGVIDVGPVTYAVDRRRRSSRRSASRATGPARSAPFSLLTYDDARKHAAMIREVVDDRRMPPWHADPRYGHFAERPQPDRPRAGDAAGLGRAGGPAGRSRDLPPAKTFPEGWTIGTPDVVFEIPEPRRSPPRGWSSTSDVRVPTGFTEDRWIQAAEARPGDRVGRPPHHRLRRRPQGRQAAGTPAWPTSAATPRATCPRSIRPARRRRSRPAPI